MLTPITLKSIALLTDIGGNGLSSRLGDYDIPRDELLYLLAKLEAGGLIRRISLSVDNLLDSYELAVPILKITLLDILEATGEHLNCNHPTSEEFYTRYRAAAQKLGVVNHMTRLYLQEVKLVDL